MGSKLRQTQDSQKAATTKQLEARLALLVSKGIEKRRIDKDTLVRKLRAHIEAINIRLSAIDANEKKTAELAAAKAAKAAAPKKEAAKEEKAAEAPKEKKEKKEKKPKEAAAEDAEKKEKKEKKPKAAKAEAAE